MRSRFFIPRLALLIAACWAQLAAAQSRGAGEFMTNRVDGSVVIGTDGKVVEHRLQTRVDPQIAAAIDRAVARWRFEPVRVGEARMRVEAPMRIVLTARQEGANYQVRVDNVRVPGGNVLLPDAGPPAEVPPTPGSLIAIKKRDGNPIPRYPEAATRGNRVAAKVLVAIRISPEGSVQDAVAVQTSLMNVRGPGKLSEDYRVLFERATTAAIKRWKFDRLYASGASPRPEAASGLMVVNYVLPDVQVTPASPGNWQFENRGARREIPWLQAADPLQRASVSDFSESDGVQSSRDVASKVKLVSGDGA